MGKYTNLVRQATRGVEYWTHAAVRQFIGDLSERMERQGLSRAALAAHIGTSPAYVTKVMRGDVNFTLETMTKLAGAVGGRVSVAIVDVAAPSDSQAFAQAIAWDPDFDIRRQNTSVPVIVRQRFAIAGTAANDHFVGVAQTPATLRVSAA